MYGRLATAIWPVVALAACSGGGAARVGAAGPGEGGAACHDGLGDQDGDGEATTDDCLWALICPGPAAEMARR